METAINTSSNINSNVEYINKAKAALEHLFNDINAFESKNGKEATYGYAGIPHVLDRVRETGIDKIFLVSSDYHGRYEDDDCYFTYWDEDKKEFFTDTWSTRFAAPNYDYYEMPISFRAGWEEGMIDKEAFLKNRKEVQFDIINKATFKRDVAEKYRLRVSVNGGRKFKGEGYLIDIEESSYRFATPMYRNHSEGYGISTTRTAVIWNPIDNTINRANYNYVKYLDEDTIMEQYKEWANYIVNKAIYSDIKPTGSNGRYILDINYSLDRFLTEIWAPRNNDIDISDAYDPDEEARKKKESEFRASKMPGIIEWVKNNTDKTGEEIILLAIHIFNKKYGK